MVVANAPLSNPHSIGNAWPWLISWKKFEEKLGGVKEGGEGIYGIRQKPWEIKIANHPTNRKENLKRREKIIWCKYEVI